MRDPRVISVPSSLEHTAIPLGQSDNRRDQAVYERNAFGTAALMVIGISASQRNPLTETPYRDRPDAEEEPEISWLRGARDWARTDPHECHGTSLRAVRFKLGWARKQPKRQLFGIANNGWIDIKMVSRPLLQQQNLNRVKPIQKPGLNRFERDEVKAKRPSMWNIVVYNDDHTPVDFVVFVLTKVFHRSTEDALALTLVVQTKGKGIAGTYTYEVAVQKQCEVMLMARIEEHPLQVAVERA